MTYSFNLIDQPWIPCAMPDGSHTELSLRDTLLQAHEIREIFDQSPLVTAALHRLLLAVLHRNFGPASRSDWQKLWQAKRFDPDRLTAYFSDWHDRFDLFDDKYPFYQVAGLELKPKKVKEVEINDLLPELARGNTLTLFDHTTDQTSPPLSPPEAAWALLTIQMYKLAGGKLVGDMYSYDAPIARAICFLVGGATLFETLVLNLVLYQGDEPIPASDNDLPAWEQDKAETSGIPQGYLDYLTWQTLSLRLLPTQTSSGEVEIARVRVGLGRKFERGGVFDPACAYKKNLKAKPNQDPWPATRYKQDRALWRDSAPLFRLTDENKRPPSALKWISQLVNSGILDAQRPYRLLAFGQCTDQADIFFWRHEHLPLPAQYLTAENLVEALEFALKNTEKVADCLKWATETLARYALYPLKATENLAKAQKDEVNLVNHLGVTEAYWSVLEGLFLDFIQRLPDDPDTVLADWNESVRSSAFRAFDEATNDLDQSARVLRAIAKGRSHLAQSVYKALSQNS